ncbi:hypothetical protein D3C81_2142360 [compost metagenome]
MGLKQAQCHLRGVEQGEVGQLEGTQLRFMQQQRRAAGQDWHGQVVQGALQRLAIDAGPQVQEHGAGAECADGALQVRAGNGVFQYFDREPVAGEQPGA